MCQELCIWAVSKAEIPEITQSPVSQTALDPILSQQFDIKKTQKTAVLRLSDRLRAPYSTGVILCKPLTDRGEEDSGPFFNKF